MATIIIENTNISNEVYKALETFISNIDKSARIKRISQLDEAINSEFYSASEILKEYRNHKASGFAARLSKDLLGV